MKAINFLKFFTRPPTLKLPPQGEVVSYFDPVTEKIVAKDFEGNEIKFDGDGGSTADITTEPGSGSPAAGALGEFLQAERVNLLGLADGVAQNVTSRVLTAGDWDVRGLIQFTGSALTSEYRSGAISSISAGTDYAVIDGRGTSAEDHASSIVPYTRRFSLAATTTIYLVAQAGVTSGTIEVTGIIAARRVR